MHQTRLSALLLTGLAVAVPAGACPAQGAAPQVAPPSQEAPQAQEDGDAQGADPRADEAIEAIRTGDLTRARRLLDLMFVDDRTAAAEIALAEGNPILAVAAADEALSVESLQRKERGALLMLRGRSVYAVAESDPGQASLFEEAQANFEQAAQSGGGVAAAFRASRAARMIGAKEESLDLARSAVQWIDGGEGRGDGLNLDQPYTRTWAEAAFGNYVDAVGAAGDAGDAGDEAAAARAALFEETRTALERTIGDHPTDPWAYTQLANLYGWEGRSDEGFAALEAGIDLAPESTELHSALVRALGDRAQARAAANGLAGNDLLDARYRAIVDWYGAFSQQRPENALGYWYRGYEVFYQAVGRLGRSEDPREMFADAASLFTSCAERNADYASACTDYKILSELGIGWAQFNASETDAAAATFLGLDALRPLTEAAGSTAALDLALRSPDGQGGTVTQLPSALGGIDLITQGYISNPSDRAALTKAAELADAVFALRPKNPNLANNAGFLNRDASMLWEDDARQRLSMATTDAQKAVAQESRDKGQALIERSYAAYQTAAALAPNDVRVVNDTGLVMVYYIRTDPVAAEGYFKRSIADGEVQLKDEAMDPEIRAALTEAWGDAHENMGILEWTVRGNPEPARAWFGKALEIGPPSRNWMKRQLLPLLDQWIETGERPAGLGPLEERLVWTHNP